VARVEDVAVAAQGRQGIGYTYGHRAIAEVVESTLSPVVVGADALAPPRAWAAMQAAVRNFGRQGLCAMAIAAVDIALWDLRAKLLDLSLADSLGRFREAIPAYGSGGFTSYTDAELAEQLGRAGCRRVKIKVGREPERDPERLAAAREAIGPGVELMVDANGAFERRAAARWAGRYAEHGVTYFEESLRRQVRSAAMSVSTVANWASNFLVATFFLTLTGAITIQGTFWLYAGFGVLAVLFFAFRLPETKDRSLEEISHEVATAEAEAH
jgi:L-alanine-DL-glutamate epimerase-like enolase superfamily enzyme